MKDLALYKNLFLLVSIVTSYGANASLWSKCDLREKKTLTIKSFDSCSQSKLDAFYRELEAGSIIPDGTFDGKVQISGRDAKSKIFQKLANILPDVSRELEEFFLERVWAGKIFYRQNSNKAVLFNRIREAQQIKQMFPAHVYYGHSLLDAKKLSIIIDYEFNQDIEGYRPSVDWLVNEDGITVRDEIRKVNEGLYLGRAYVKGKFLLNFVLGLEK